MYKKLKFTIFILFIIFVVSCSTFQKNDLQYNKRSKTFLNLKKQLQKRAKSFLLKSKFAQAELVLDSLLHFAPDAWAYQERGKLYMKHKTMHHQAEYCFRQAIQCDPNDAENYYYLGSVYQNGPYSIYLASDMFRKAIRRRPYYREAYYQLTLSIFQHDYTWGLQPLEELVLIDPNFKDAYTIYYRVGTSFYEFDRLQSTLEKLVIQHPLNPRYHLDLVEVLYRNNHYEKALEQLRLYQSRFAYHAMAIQDLLEAKIRFALNQDTLGHALYWQGVDATVSAKECDVFFRDMVFLATNDEYDAYRYGKPELKKGLIYSFWKSRDPTLTTPYNERIPEHYRRLQYTRKYNRRYPEKESLSYFLNDFSEPAERSENTLIELYSGTKGSKRQQEVDDMGLIYIRHGEPDIQETYAEVEAQTNLSWLYFKNEERPAMAFHFRIKDSREKSASMTDGYRLELEPLYQNRDFVYTSDTSLVTLATVTETFDYKPPYGKFEFLANQYMFKGSHDQTVLYLWYQIPEDAINDDTATSTCHQEVALYNTYWDEVARKEQDKKIRSSDSFPVLQRFDFLLPAGTYYAGIHQQNQQNRKEGEEQLKIEVPWFNPVSLQVSSLMLGDLDPNMAYLEEESYDVSVAKLITPNIHQTFSVDQPIFLYFEIYNLTVSDNRTNFTVTIRITQKERFLSTVEKIVTAFQTPDADSKLVEISFSDTYHGDRSDEFLTRSVSLENYSPGVYELKAEVKDNNKLRTAYSQTEFQLNK